MNKGRKPQNNYGRNMYQTNSINIKRPKIRMRDQSVSQAAAKTDKLRNLRADRGEVTEVIVDVSSSGQPRPDKTISRDPVSPWGLGRKRSKHLDQRQGGNGPKMQRRMKYCGQLLESYCSFREEVPE